MRMIIGPTMALDVNNARRTSTLSFTLPISCQICLGKVKQPLLCPNNHVFCAACLEIWLERNQQCPACRTPIDEQNPCQEIRGGMNIEEEGTTSMSSAELRRARFEMLFKDYESELSQVEAKMEAIKVENTALREQLEKSSKMCVNPVVTDVDLDALAAVTKKLQEVTKICEAFKQEMKKSKKENEDLKGENDLLLRENQRLRMEITSRSPHRYGRTTVAALQSQIDSYEKEVQQLNKALEKSDGYIEDLEGEVAQLRGKDTLHKPEAKIKSSFVRKPPVKSVPKNSHKKQLFKDDTEVNNPGISSTSLTSNNASPEKGKNGILVTGNSGDSPSKSVKKVTFSLPQENTPQGSQSSSFDLECPSPLKSPSDSASPGTTVSQSSSGMAVPTQSSEKALVSGSDRNSQNRSQENISKQNLSSTSGINSNTASLELVNPVDKVSSSNKPGCVVKTHNGTERVLDDTVDIENELDDLDISVTPEIKDCMKLFSQAERNVQKRHSLGGSTVAPVEEPSSSKEDISNSDLTMSKPLYSVNTGVTSIDSHWKDEGFSNEIQHQEQTISSNSYSVSRSNGSLANVSSNYVSSNSQISLYTSENFTPSKQQDLGSSDKSSSYFTKGVTVNGPIATSLVSNSLHPGSHGEEIKFPESRATHKTIDSVWRISSGNADRPEISTSSSSSKYNSSFSEKNAESLTSSLMKLEQTLAAHRASSIHISRDYTVPQTSLSAVIPSSTFSTSLSLPSASIASSSLPSAGNFGNLGISSSSSVPSVGKYVGSHPPLDSGLTRTTQYMPSAYPSATSLSSSILAGKGSPVSGSSNIGSTFGETNRNGYYHPMNNSLVPPLNNGTFVQVPFLASTRLAPTAANSTYVPPVNSHSLPPTTSYGAYVPPVNSHSLPPTTSYPTYVPPVNNHSLPPSTSYSTYVPPSSKSVYASNNSRFVPPTTHTKQINNISTGVNNTYQPPSSGFLEKPTSYSYISNSSLNSNDLSSLDSSFMPEPKKRLFETDTDDTDISFSPVKASKLR